MTEVQTPVCTHDRHYVSIGYDRECLDCGHKWTVTPPLLEAHVEVQFSCSARVDLVAYYNSLGANAQEAYKTLDITEVGYDDEYERPIAFLYPADPDGPSSALPWFSSGIMSESSDVADGEARLYRRKGANIVWSDPGWSESDLDTLRSQVPWLNEWHTSQENAPEPDPDEIHSRIPGPLDSPLDFG